jgi:hypothetical protein
MPTSPTDATFECAFLADDALNHYVKVHDSIFKQQATFGSMVRNLFGGGPDFSKLLEEARSTDRLWATVQEHVAQCFTTFESGFSTEERDFFTALLPWVQAVRHTTKLLCRRQEALLHKLKGDALSLAEYQRIEREYADSVDAYMRLGALVQPKMERIFDDIEHGRAS